MLLGFLSCKEALALLDDFVDRELAPHEQHQVERHLRLCAQCARKFAFERGFVADLRAKLVHLEAPPYLMSEIKGQIASIPAPASPWELKDQPPAPPPGN